MKILDRYILGKFLSAFLFVVITLTVVICVIDYTEKNDDFIHSGLGWGQILKEYYLNFFPYYANMLSPITVFIATVFVTAQLAARTEIIAILSSGVSFIRFMVPYAVGAVLIGALLYVLGGWVIPHANARRVAFEVAYIKDKFTYSGHNIHIKVAPDTYAYMESYSNATNTGYQFALETIKDRRLLTKTRADRIVWRDTLKRWRMENVVTRSIAADGSEKLNKIAAKDTVLRLTPADFESDYLAYETLTNSELNAHITELEMRGADNIAPYRIEKYLRLTYPFAIIILTGIGVILSGRKSREGPGFNIALGFLLAFVYIIFFIMSRSIAQAGAIDPLLACWLPNIVFSAIGLGLYKTIPQ